LVPATSQPDQLAHPAIHSTCGMNGCTMVEMNKITTIDVGRYSLHIHNDLSVSASERKPGPRIKDGHPVRVYPIEIRYAWPSELELMAGLAGTELSDRWSGWDRRPFTAGSGMYVAVYKRQQTV